MATRHYQYGLCPHIDEGSRANCFVARDTIPLAVRPGPDAILVVIDEALIRTVMDTILVFVQPGFGNVVIAVDACRSTRRTEVGRSSIELAVSVCVLEAFLANGIGDDGRTAHRVA